MVTAVYAGILALMFLGLSVRTVRLRAQCRVAMGDGGQPLLLRAVRVHANFAEYVPMTLLLMFMLEMQGAQHMLMHVLGLALLIGRGVHAFGVSQEPERLTLRTVGTALTFSALGMAALALLAFNLGGTVP